MRARIAAILLAILALPCLYLVAGAAGGAIPANRDWRPLADGAGGVTIWVEDNGIHTGLVLPKVAAGIDWRRIAAARHLADPRYAAHDHVAIGWGDRAFYLGTPTWSDLRLSTLVAAAIGSDATLIHVDHIPRPAAGPDVRALTLRPAEYRRLAAHIAATLVPGGTPIRGYGPYDAFYPARGHYDLLNTCNAWTGAALRQAGVRMGRWTPFPKTVMQWL